MEARATKRDKNLQLTYDLPHRIHSSRIYPAPAPNGSTIVIYGHTRGIRVLWRGGRRRRTHSSPRRPNGVAKPQDVIIIDDSDDERADTGRNEHAGDYEYAEDEMDPDCPHSGIIQHLDIRLDSAVLHLAIPAIPPSQALSITKTHALVVVACADGATKLLSFPLAPPADEKGDSSDGLLNVDLPTLGQPVRAVTAKLLPIDQDERVENRSRSRGGNAEAEILIATASSLLQIFAVDVTSTSIKKRQTSLICSISLGSAVSSVSFHPSPASTQLLVGDAIGATRLYDPYAFESPNGQRSGKWLMSYLTPYNASQPSSARRKRVLSCAWVLGGRSILALLEDGEWGIWDVVGGAQSGRSAGECSISGFVGASGDAAEPMKSKKPSRLAPMTPNTRKSKSEDLFSASSKAASGALTAGICVTSLPSRTGQGDESVVMWFSEDIYSIPSMQQFWQRSTSNGGNLGSLYAPGMTHISDIDLQNESITAISQLSNGGQTSAFGQMNTQRDLVISTEHRLIVTQTNRPLAPSRQLFQRAAERPITRDRDQHMLDAGDLDLGGLNRMLDSRMDDARPRKVGFAH